MKPRPGDVFSYQGKDFVVEGVLNYKLGGKIYPLARAADGDEVRFIEPLMDDADDRLLFFREVTDLRVGSPPPATISYKGGSYVPKLSGPATVTIDGAVDGRSAGPCEIWRYRAGGDVYLQIEKWPSRTVTLHGESVHKDMVTFFPAP